MDIKPHKNASTTPRIQALNQARREPMTVLARRFGMSVETLFRWEHRDFVDDRSHTSLTPGQEAIAVYL